MENATRRYWVRGGGGGGGHEALPFTFEEETRGGGAEASADSGLGWCRLLDMKAESAVRKSELWPVFSNALFTRQHQFQNTSFLISFAYWWYELIIKLSLQLWQKASLNTLIATTKDCLKMWKTPKRLKIWVTGGVLGLRWNIRHLKLACQHNPYSLYHASLNWSMHADEWLKRSLIHLFL